MRSVNCVYFYTHIHREKEREREAPTLLAVFAAVV